MKKFFKIFVSLLQATFDFDNYVYEIRFSAYREIFVAYVRFIFEIYATLKKYKTYTSAGIVKFSTPI